MKKFISFLLVVCLVLSVSVCAFADKKDEKKEEEKKPKITKTEEINEVLDECEKQIDNAVKCYKDGILLVYDNWKAERLQYFYDKDLYEEEKDKISSPSVNLDILYFHNYAEQGDKAMEKALDLIKRIEKNDDTEEYYDAIKDYYKTVNSFKSFATTFPEGYSKLTYMQAIKETYQEIDDAKSELDFVR